MLNYYPNDSFTRLDKALKLCETASDKALDASAYADARIADPQNSTGIWNRFTFVNDWRIAGEGIALYVHRPLFTADELESFFTDNLITPDYAFDLSAYANTVRQLIQEGKDLSSNAKQKDQKNPYDAPREVWYESPQALSQFVSGLIPIHKAILTSEAVPFLNGRTRAEIYLDVFSEVFRDKSQIGVYHRKSDSNRNGFICRPLGFGDGSNNLIANDYYFNGINVIYGNGRFVGGSFSAEGATQIPPEKEESPLNLL